MVDIKIFPTAFTVPPVELSCSSPTTVIFCNPFLFREDVTYTLWLGVSNFLFIEPRQKTSWKRNHNQRLDSVPSLTGFFYRAWVQESRSPFVTFFTKYIICIPSGRGQREVTAFNSPLVFSCVHHFQLNFWESQGQYAVIISHRVCIKISTLPVQFSVFTMFVKAFFWWCLPLIVFCIYFNYFTSSHSGLGKKRNERGQSPCLNRNTPFQALVLCHQIGDFELLMHSQ